MQRTRDARPPLCLHLLRIATCALCVSFGVFFLFFGVFVQSRWRFVLVALMFGFSGAEATRKWMDVWALTYVFPISRSCLVFGDVKVFLMQN